MRLISETWRYTNIQMVMPSTWVPVLMARNDARYVYVCIYMVSIFREIPPVIDKTRENELWGAFMGARYVTYALQMYSQCFMLHPVVVTDRPIMKLQNVETLNMIPSSFILLHSQAHEIITGPICYHDTCFNWWHESPLHASNFKRFPLISQSKYKKLETLIRWYTVVSGLA